MDVFITKIRKYLKEDPELSIENVFGVCLLYTSPSPQTVLDLVCRLLLEKKNHKISIYIKYTRYSKKKDNTIDRYTTHAYNNTDKH